jgi:HNH endonuclease
MCTREGTSLQAGMNFGLGGTHSVILLSLRPNAPYHDRIEDGGFTLIYEGHDHPKTKDCANPKLVDQPEFFPSGAPTQNGKFHRAAQAAKHRHLPPERVRAYEKIKPGIWSYNGMFHLVDSWREPIGGRAAFKFRLEAVEGEEDLSMPPPSVPSRRRIIPTAIKLAVWKRDGGRCVQCGATDELHFDHDLPWSKGGTSISIDNVQLLCMRHNLKKSAKII